MDDIIQTVKLEVTLDCEEGTTLRKMWSYVELAQRRLLQRNGVDSESYTIDDALKRYLWQYILQLSEMTFINEGSVIYDAASKGAAQSDGARDFLALSADETESRFPNLLICASCEAINKEIFGRVEGNERLLRSVNSYKIIQALSRSREKGITQVQLSKMFELDPRSTFHFIKTIDHEGLIVKFTTYDSGNTTNLWMLRRFITNRQGAMNKVPALGSGKGKEAAPIPSNNSPSLTAYLVGNDLRRRASDILEAAGSRYMPETDLMDALMLDLWNMQHRRYFHRVLHDLSEGGFAEKAELQLPDADLSGFDPEVYKPTAEPMDVDEGHENAEPIANVPHNYEANAESSDFEMLVSAPGKKTKGKRPAKQPAKPKKSRQERQADRSQRERHNRGLADGHSYRRCVRFIKPYIDRGSVRTRLGVPLEQSAEDLGNVPMIDLDAADNEGRDDGSSEDDELDVETLKEKDDILYVMNNHSVQVGALATLAPEAQVFRLIALSGSHGIVSRAIQFLLGWNALKPLYRCLTHLEQTPVFLPDGSWPGVYTSEECKRENREHMDERLIFSVEEFMGREHRKRFFVNPLAKMAIKSLTAYSGAVTAQQPTTLSQPALPAPSQAVSDSPAAATVVASGSRDGASLTPLGELATPTEQPETRPQALHPASEPADMIQSHSLSDIYAESKERRVSPNAIIREYAVLGMLKHESVFACNTTQAMRCDKLVKSYALANMDSPVMTPTLSKTLLNYSMDLRTFKRVVASLAEQNRLLFKEVDFLTEVARPDASSKVELAIACDTDPTGPIVHAYIAQLRDLRKLNKQTVVRAIHRIADPVPVVRTKGAEERDRDFLLRKMDTDESRAQGTKNLSMKHTIGRECLNPSNSTRPLDSHGHPIIMGPKAYDIKPTTEDETLEDCDAIHTHLQQAPRGIGRAKNLYDYLANNLADKVDHDYVYENFAFRSSFLFYRLPLRLFLRITGGIAYFQELLPFICNGSCTQVDGRTDGSAEAEVDDTPDMEACSLENINRRLATPIDMLPPVVREFIEKRRDKTNEHFQRLLKTLYTLQLLHPVDTAKNIVSMPPPPDVKDVFSSVPFTNPKDLGFGYQLVGKVRLLSKDGYDLAPDVYNSMLEHRLNLTTHYLGNNIYNMLDKDGAFSYWTNLQMTAAVEAKHLLKGHPLYGIGLAYYWVLDVSLDDNQTKLLHSYVNEAEFTTPLDDPNLLTEAANKAGTTREVARRYFQHIHASLSVLSSRIVTFKQNRNFHEANTMKRIAYILEETDRD
ncbi:hypothetical protein H4S07_002594 [Coemansia furcata]|uniref:Uncharacterized protein n=1 Tax=Coemansia furcata TaxID=417177 RepID=A0ACC1LL73_9FUNG|nr:hypothetical protein H4S07_002594 [Coemansia furcata]